MIDLLKLFDAIYTGIDMDTPVLYSPTDIIAHNNGILSRFDLRRVNYEPYELSYRNISKLQVHIKLMETTVQTCMDFTNFNKFVVSYDQATNIVFIKDPKIIHDTMYNNNITILGLLSILLCKYDTDAFKNYIIDNYLSTEYEYINKYDTWILNASNRSKLDITKDFILQLIELNRYKSIKYYNNQIPYTFSWRT